MQQMLQVFKAAQQGNANVKTASNVVVGGIDGMNFKAAGQGQGKNLSPPLVVQQPVLTQV